MLFLGKENDCWNVDHMLETVHVLQLLSNGTSYPNKGKEIVGKDINFWLTEASLIPYMSTKTIPSMQIEVKKRNNAEVYHRKVSWSLNIFSYVLRLVHTRRLVAATCHGNMSQKIKSDRICVTCCSNKILLQRQRFFYKSSPVHTKPFVAGMFHCNVLLQLVAQPVHTEWSVAMTCCCKLSPDLHTQSDLLSRLVAATCSPTCTHRVICRQDLLLQLVAPHVHTVSVLLPWLVAATCHLMCSHLYRSKLCSG